MSEINELFNKQLRIANIGLESFYKDLKAKEIDVIHVNWRPPAGGNKKMIKLLDKLKK
ncbi:MAG: fdrA domain protein [Clostridiales bacterium]|nr:fdrA domain protein [Clostridiales bacterium]